MQRAVELSTVPVAVQRPFRPRGAVLNRCLKAAPKLTVLTAAPEAGISWDRLSPVSLGPMGLKTPDQ